MPIKAVAPLFDEAMELFLDKNVPLISRVLLNPWRVASLGVGLVLLVLGSVYLPSDDWDAPLCLVMGLPAYVLAPWTVRQTVGLRRKWLVLATFAFWLTVDGTRDDDLDEVDSNEWHSVSLGPGDEIAVRGKGLKDVASLRDSLNARHAWRQSKCGTNRDGEVDCIELRTAGSPVGLVALALNACLDARRQKVFVFDMIGDDGLSVVSVDTQLELPEIPHGFGIDLSARHSNWHFVSIDRGGRVKVDGSFISDEKALQLVFAEFVRARRQYEPQIFIRADRRLSFAHVFRVLRTATAAWCWRHYLVGCADEKTGFASISLRKSRSAPSPCGEPRSVVPLTNFVITLQHGVFQFPVEKSLPDADVLSEDNAAGN